MRREQVASSVSPTAATRSSPSRSASAAAYSRGVSAGARPGPPCARPVPDGAARRRSTTRRRARRRRTAAMISGAATASSTSSDRERPSATALWRADGNHEPPGWRRPRAAPQRSGRTPASRHRGSRSRPTRAHRSRAPRTGRSARRVRPGTKPVTSRAGMPDAARQHDEAARDLFAPAQRGGTRSRRRRRPRRARAAR